MMARISVLKGIVLFSMLFAFIGEATAQSKRLPGPRVNKPVGPPARPSQPAAEVIAKHGKWQVQCTDIPTGPSQKPAAAQGGSSGKVGKNASSQGAKAGPKTVRQCGMLQSTSSKERKGITLTLVMGTARQKKKVTTMMRILVPVGVYLPLGIALEIDGEAVGRVPFIRCLPQICTAFAEVTTKTLTKMRKGANANFIIYEAPGVGLTLPVSLKGFTAAYNALLKL